MTYALNIKIQDKTLKQTDNLLNQFKSPSRSDVIRRSIELSSLIVKSISQGDKIFIHGKSGRREISLPGLTDG